MSKAKGKFSINTFGLRVVPSILLCIALGFVGALFFQKAYEQIRAVEHEGVFFLASKIIIISGFILGITLKRILNHIVLLYLELGVLVLLIAEMLIIYNFSSGILQVDYIFYTDIVLFFAFLNVFTTGMIASGLKNFRLWGFLIGGIGYILYSIFNIGIEIKPENYLMPMVCILAVEFALHSIIPAKTFAQKGEFKTFPFTDWFFFSSLALFVCHMATYYSKFENPESFLAGTGSGLFIFNVLFHYGVFKNKVKWKYHLGRLVLIVNLTLTVHQSRFELASPFLFFLDTACIAFFRPSRYNYKSILFYLLLGGGLFAITGLLNQYYLKYEFKLALILLFVTLLFLPGLSQKHLGVTGRVSLFLLLTLFGFYFYSPLPYDYKINFTKAEDLRPIPFHFLDIRLGYDRFVYYNTNLPFRNSDTLPKRSVFRNKIVVLGLGTSPEVILTYVYHLNKNGYPFLIFQEKDGLILSDKTINFSYIEYPMFRVYFPASLEEMTRAREQNKEKQNWEKEHVENRLRGLSSLNDIAEVLSNIIKYSPGSLADAAIEYRNHFYYSYKSYAEHFYKSGEYEKAIKMAMIAYKFTIPDDDLYEFSYNSILRITPEKEYLPLMNILNNKSRFKEQILKRLYPILLSMGKREDAVSKIDELIDFYLANDESESSSNVKNLKIEKAKIYLQSSNIREAEELIVRESKKYPDSIVWQKLQGDLNDLKESLYKTIQIHNRENISTLRSID